MIIRDRTEPHVIFGVDAHEEGYLGSDEREDEIDVDAVEIAMETGNAEEGEEGEDEGQDGHAKTHVGDDL